MNTATLDLVDQWLPLDRSTEPLTSTVEVDDVTVEASAVYDLTVDGSTTFYPWIKPDLPDDYGIGVIVGGSGSGKSTLLAHFGKPAVLDWDYRRSVAAHFPTADEAAARLNAVGLSSVPAWGKPFHVLSNGERFRAELARTLNHGAIVDEFTSVVDRTVAAAASRSLAKFVRAGGARRLTLATVHRDVLPWLEPDWIIDTDAGLYALRPRECLHRPSLVADVYEVRRAMWDRYMEHHYLTHDLHPFARCYVATVWGQPAAFAAAIPFPHGAIQRGWRETRLVTLPDYQGLGIGPRLSDWVAEAHVRAGYRYFSKTTHPRLGGYRDVHGNWRPTSQNRKRATGKAAVSFGRWSGSMRLSYSHEYVKGADA